MKGLICAGVILACICGNVWADEKASVAKVSYYELKPALIDCVLSKPENAELKNKYQAAKEQEKIKSKKFEKIMLEAQKSGEMKLPMESPDMSGYEVENKVENLAKKELVDIVNKIFKDKYQLILNETHGDVILHTDIVIPDITQNLKQYLNENTKPAKQ